MTNVLQLFHLLVIALAGWLNRHRQAVIDYLTEENLALDVLLHKHRAPYNLGFDEDYGKQ